MRKYLYVIISMTLIWGMTGMASAATLYQIDYSSSGEYEADNGTRTYQNFYDAYSGSTPPAIITFNKTYFNIAANEYNSGTIPFWISHQSNENITGGAWWNNGERWVLDFYDSTMDTTAQRVTLGSSNDNWVDDKFNFTAVDSGWRIVLRETEYSSGSSQDRLRLDKASVPIPAAAWLLGSGLVGLVAIRRRKK